MIGESVDNCHPKHSVDKVNQILSDFKAARYLGTLGVTQGITEQRRLKEKEDF